MIWGDLGDRLKFRWILVSPLGGPKLREPGQVMVKCESPGALTVSDRLEESGYSIQDTTCYMAKFQEGCRTHRIQDAD